jgi:hypothetical protein
VNTDTTSINKKTTKKTNQYVREDERKITEMQKINVMVSSKRQITRHVKHHGAFLKMKTKSE